MNNIRPIAIYLPQYHAIPENDLNWGKGFTEWINVKKARPLFEGHYQPHIPHEAIGYYDLHDPEVLVQQARLAKDHGIYGFAFYHYWFNGKRLLETPVNNLINTGKPDFPFCLIWANENWTKKWDGQNDHIIQGQTYCPDDDNEHMEFLCRNIFIDNRYIKIDGKPLFIVYRTELLPDAKQTAIRWRETAKKNGFEDIYLVRVESFENNIDPQSILFDAAMEFAPDRYNIGLQLKIDQLSDRHIIRDYETSIHRIAAKEIDYKIFRCVFPSWDNTPRRKEDGVIFLNTSSFYFEFSVRQAVKYTLEKLDEKERFMFINAWNEWAEGCHIEPDQKNNYAFLKIIKNYVNTLSPTESYLHEFDVHFNQMGLNYFNAMIKLNKLSEHADLLERMMKLKRMLNPILRLFK